MSATTRTAQQPLGLGQTIAPFVAIALALVLAAVVGLSQLTTTKSQAAPAAGSAPGFIDHGSRDEMVTAPAAGSAPVVIDHGSRDEMGTGAGSSSKGTGGSNGTRRAQ